MAGCRGRRQGARGQWREGVRVLGYFETSRGKSKLCSLMVDAVVHLGLKSMEMPQDVCG